MKQVRLDVANIGFSGKDMISVDIVHKCDAIKQNESELKKYENQVINIIV